MEKYFNIEDIKDLKRVNVAYLKLICHASVWWMKYSWRDRKEAKRKDNTRT